MILGPYETLFWTFIWNFLKGNYFSTLIKALFIKPLVWSLIAEPIKQEIFLETALGCCGTSYVGNDDEALISNIYKESLFRCRVLQTPA